MSEAERLQQRVQLYLTMAIAVRVWDAGYGEWGWCAPILISIALAVAHMFADRYHAKHQ